MNRLFYIAPENDKSTKVVFKRFAELFREAAQNPETYFPDLPSPEDGISDQAFGAFFGATSVQLQIGSSALGHGKGEPCAMRHFATRAHYSIRHFFRILAVLVEKGYVTSDHHKQGVPAKREYTLKLWASVKPLLQKYFKVVPKDWKAREEIERWTQNLIQNGRDYLAAKALSQARAREEPPADPAVAEAAMRKIREMLSGKRGGDPPAV